eukprot:scaffold11032_cov122-Cylindrotheca_fusiformis.AAC.9
MGYCTTPTPTSKEQGEMRSASSAFQSLRGSSSLSRQASSGAKHLLEKSRPSSPPLLMLEGDEYDISDEGIARTFYRIDCRHSPTSKSYPTALSVEEVYDIPSARKRFVLRGDSKAAPIPPKVGTETTVNIGTPHQIVDFQEIAEGLSKGAGTGSLTWESSLAMAMFFSSRPHLLRGNVVELGSGTGAGGILMSSLASPTLNRARDVQSVTLTDYNSQVLEQCRENIARATALPSFMNVSRLDWYDFLHSTKDSMDFLHKYDTVVVCDCAYLYADVEALYKATMCLLRKDMDSRIHIFGPYNRGAIEKLLEMLKQEDNQTSVSTEFIDMERYRLHSPRGWDDGSLAQTECSVASKSGASFVHITCSLCFEDPDETVTAQTDMSEID